jgi:hypothetical protein
MARYIRPLPKIHAKSVGLLGFCNVLNLDCSTFTAEDVTDSWTKLAKAMSIELRHNTVL